MNTTSPICQAAYHAGCSVRHLGKALVALWSIRKARALYVVLLGAILFFLCGCSTFKRTGAVKVDPAGNVSATNAENAEKPASISRTETTTDTQVQPGARVTGSILFQGTELPAVFEMPAFTIHSVTNKVEAAASNSRAPDKTVELRKEDNSARLPLLYAAIAAAVAAVVFVIMKWPGVATICGVASAVFFVAWQAAGLPSWFWMLGAALLVGGACLVLGYKRAEWDANGNLIPDKLEKPKS